MTLRRDSHPQSLRIRTECHRRHTGGTGAGGGIGAEPDGDDQTDDIDCVG